MRVTKQLREELRTLKKFSKVVPASDKEPFLHAYSDVRDSAKELLQIIEDLIKHAKDGVTPSSGN
ncbi:hypothetical protein L2734_00685 [Parashewanella spongiae]|uniref:hypothetical protein n=1 Tax=Parashewanella spongiae TaxID=342950 RepID=UPI00105A3754|nr:hypothetical protein [Parashewanella spongiae]MCL1076701.1 hypothetical protein [Parashewanella spongiae]